MMFFDKLEDILQSAETKILSGELKSNNSFISRRNYKRKRSRTNVALKKKLFKYVLFTNCPYCKFVFLVEDLTVEHKIPLCLGGTDNQDNITLACSSCNHQKGKIEGKLIRDLKKKIAKAQLINNFVFPGEAI